MLPKSEAPFDAFINISLGVWYSHARGFIMSSHGFAPSRRGYDVIYTAVPAIGKLARPPPRRSRISPPVPVAAPLNGSTVVGKLCVSAFNDMTVSMVFSVKKSGRSGFTG